MCWEKFSHLYHVLLILVAALLFSGCALKENNVIAATPEPAIPPVPVLDDGSVPYNYNMHKCSETIHVVYADFRDVSEDGIVRSIRYMFVKEHLYVITVYNHMDSQSEGVWIDTDGDGEMDEFHPTAQKAAEKYGSVCRMFTQLLGGV